jgi:UDP:flavonoid glycosyltransferase YjiC (YdhE family)
VGAPALLAGKPLLMLPVFVEQTMTAYRVVQQGLGQGIEAALRRLVSDPERRTRTAAFGRACAGYRPEIAIDAIADDIDAMLSV